MLCGVGHVCEAAVAGEDDDEPEEVDPRTWIYPREREFEEPEDGV